jgi:hypothetical protein
VNRQNITKTNKQTNNFQKVEDFGEHIRERESKLRMVWAKVAWQREAVEMKQRTRDTE